MHKLENPELNDFIDNSNTNQKSVILEVNSPGLKVEFDTNSSEGYKNIASQII